MVNSTDFNHTIRISNFMKSDKHCCSKDCFRNFYELQEEALYRFGEDLKQCSQDVKEAALLMNLREHFYDPQSVSRGSGRKRQRIAYSVAPFGSMCRSAYILLWDIGVSTLKSCVTCMTGQNYTIRPRVHGHSGSVATNALGKNLREQAVQFILELAENFGEASEGRQGRRNLHNVKDRVVHLIQ